MKIKGASARAGIFTMHKAVSVWTTKHSENAERFWNSYYNPQTTEVQGRVAGRSSYFTTFLNIPIFYKIVPKNKEEIIKD